MSSLIYGTLFLELIAIILPYALFTIIYHFEIRDNKKYLLIFTALIFVIGFTSLALNNYYVKEECKTSNIRPLIYNSGIVVLWSFLGFFLPIMLPDLAMPFMEMLYDVKIPLVAKADNLEFAKYVAHSFYLFLVLLPVSIETYFKCKNAPCRLNDAQLKSKLAKLKDPLNKSN